MKAKSTKHVEVVQANHSENYESQLKRNNLLSFKAKQKTQRPLSE